jgi:single-stranded-DNA-specific exonuclease
MPSPLQIQGMKEAVDRILLAVRLKQRVVVFGDYDCDGALSAAVLQVTLGRLGVRPLIYLRTAMKDMASRMRQCIVSL